MFGSFSTLENISNAAPRPKRRQVLRACDACRIKRCKCDDSMPCSTCVSRGWACSRSHSSLQPTSLSSALIQISALQERIRDLESRPRIEDLAEWSHTSKRRKSLWAKDRLLDNGSYSGPLSTAYFVACIKKYLDSHPDKTPFGPTFSYQSLPINCRQPRKIQDADLPCSQNTEPPANSEILPKARQTQYIHQFWYLYHPLLPILCEKDFTEEFASLWKMDVTMQRSSSALTDIIIANCALAQSSQSNQPMVQGGQSWTHDDISVWHYRRCKRFLDDELETPTLSTLQSSILVSVYLYNAAHPSAAYNALGTAVRIAYSLGLHRDPPPVLSITKQELRRRIWWSLYILDSRLSLELGRPALVTLYESDCRLPADDIQTARAACLKTFASTAEVTWLTYTVQLAKLLTIVRSIVVDVYEENIHEEPESDSPESEQRLLDGRESASKTLQTHLTRLQAWVEALPGDLCLSRSGSEPIPSPESFSIELDFYAPKWLQLQRVFLQLLFHDAFVSLIRPMSFLGRDGVADELMQHLHGHTNAIIRACQQLYSETDIWTHHPELSSILWSATVTNFSRLLSVTEESEAFSCLAIVVEMFQTLDSVDPSAILALTNVRRVPFAGQWASESLRTVANGVAQESQSINDEVNPLGIVPSILTDGHDASETGSPLPILDWAHPNPGIDPSLWMNDITWLQG
ncbi:hypothetical protein ASPZODRAFT_137447 [Penicilliopsis zonata CBS 506.65]|uniref:Zn(2)-C6 fungal-type domain-containing protein n=1 Tax=Penicilliopsis zonata CBS 506.65 TaxID=1073090 RepID=A0A1L9S4U9_9EURO|nr:hypothetical protein ASPZODRAFT_137447 [Penicilliopsis zonata CBS 506.65]OJJ42176.1 hypothetical protein ASPZODRAFT_137447 [Penicilliopsis zonata CBS 506.65]